MVGSLLIVLELATLAASPASEIRVTPRTPLIVLVNGANQSEVTTSAIVGALASAVRDDAAVEVVPAERLGLDAAVSAECKEHKTGCLLHEVSNLAAKEGRIYVLVVALEKKSEGVESSGVLVDGEPLQWKSWSDAEIEDDVLGRAHYFTSRLIHTGEAGAIDQWAKALVDAELRPIFEHDGQWKCFGTLRIEPGSSAAVEIDGVAVGTALGPATRLVDLKTGDRRVRLRDGKTGAITFDQAISISPLREETIRVAAPAVESTNGDALFYGGAGVAVVGTALLALAVAKPADDSFFMCIGGSCSGPDARRFAQLCDLYSSRASCRGAGSIPVVPLALSLLVSGGGSALGARVFEDVHPLIVIGASLALGIATFTIANALD